MFEIKNPDHINPYYWGWQIKTKIRSYRKELKTAGIITAALAVQAAAYGVLAHEVNKPVNR